MAKNVVVMVSACDCGRVPTVYGYFSARFRRDDYAVVCAKCGQSVGMLSPSVDSAVRAWNAHHGGQLHMLQLAVR